MNLNPRRLSERFAETAIDNAGEDSSPERAKRWGRGSTQDVTNMTALRASGNSVGIDVLQTCRPYGPLINSKNESK